MLSHLKKKKSLDSIISKFNKKQVSDSEETDSESESESEKRKRLLCEEVGNKATVNNLLFFRSKFNLLNIEILF